mmetsp:Transcript_9365/g.33158  ORF Transcript_9365/g.33158 Transcript_9365/m.33158 type:complete len:342 (-) Transcript_9365:163-1188(-)
MHSGRGSGASSRNVNQILQPVRHIAFRLLRDLAIGIEVPFRPLPIRFRLAAIPWRLRLTALACWRRPRQIEGAAELQLQVQRGGCGLGRSREVQHRRLRRGVCDRLRPRLGADGAGACRATLAPASVLLPAGAPAIPLIRRRVCRRKLPWRLRPLLRLSRRLRLAVTATAVTAFVVAVAAFVLTTLAIAAAAVATLAIAVATLAVAAAAAAAALPAVASTFVLISVAAAAVPVPVLVATSSSIFVPAPVFVSIPVPVAIFVVTTLAVSIAIAITVAVAVTIFVVAIAVAVAISVAIFVVAIFVFVFVGASAAALRLVVATFSRTSFGGTHSSAGTHRLLQG